MNYVLDKKLEVFATIIISLTIFLIISSFYSGDINKPILSCVDNECDISNK